MSKLYFNSVDNNICQSLEDCLNEAKCDGLTDTVTLIEAVPAIASEYRWCTLCGEAVELSECSKKACSSYKKPLKGNACANKGKLYNYGTEISFDLKTGKQI